MEQKKLKYLQSQEDSFSEIHNLKRYCSEITIALWILYALSEINSQKQRSI